MARAAQVAQAWKEWGIQVLVLLSFTVQVMLLILAEFRRRMDSGVLRVLVWSAYQLADIIAIYVMGHMTLISRSPEHELVAFWAPFLLMHLGGQDNITAYALEDNQLWLRHLQTLAVQVAAAAYVLYTSSIFSSHSSLLLQRATILMFLVGVVKYGERVWALRYASGSMSVSALDKRWTVRASFISSTIREDRSYTEDIIFLGHEMLGVAKDFLKGSIPYQFRLIFKEHLILQVHRIELRLHLDGKEAYKVAEVQVSLLHDVLYTKAESQNGFIRIVSSLTTAVALSLLVLLLFGSGRHSNNIASYEKVDVAITCVLAVGAGVLEAISLMRYILSSFHWHRYERGRGSTERRPGSRVLLCLRRLVSAADRRIMHSWSRSMGQHNLLQVCARSRASWISKMARQLGLEDLWNTLSCSWSVPVSPLIEKLVVKQVMDSCDVAQTSPDHILNSRGRAALKRKQQLYDRLHWVIDPDQLSLEETILVWHIATNIYLRWYSSRHEQNDLAKAVEALSNYMLFILAARPNMLPPSASRNAYVEMCHGLTSLKYTSPEDLSDLLRLYGDELNNPGSQFVQGINVLRSHFADTSVSVWRGSRLAAIFISDGSPPADMLELIGKVWVEILCYVGSRCSGYSHAKQLSDGSELITVTAILIEYLRKSILKATQDFRP